MVQLASGPERRRAILALLVAAAAAVGWMGCSSPSAAPPTVPPIAVPTVLAPLATRVPLAGIVAGPIFLLVMENKEYADLIGNPDAPFLNRLAMDNTLYEQSYAITHPSLPNYLALLAGDTFGVSSDCTDCFVDQPNLVDALEAAGRTWTAYMEDLPAPCSLVADSGGLLGIASGGYALKHNPFLYFQDIRTNPGRCKRVVPLSQLDADLAAGRAPDFAWITPNQQHDTHDAPVADGDRWLADVVPRLLSSPAWHPGAVLIVTWDEGRTSAGCCGFAAGGHIPTVVVSAANPQHGLAVSDPVTHYSVLRTIEDALHVQRLGKSAEPGVHPLFDAAAP